MWHTNQTHAFGQYNVSGIIMNDNNLKIPPRLFQTDVRACRSIAGRLQVGIITDTKGSVVFESMVFKTF